LGEWNRSDLCHFAVHERPAKEGRAGSEKGYRCIAMDGKEKLDKNAGVALWVNGTEVTYVTSQFVNDRPRKAGLVVKRTTVVSPWMARKN